MPPYSLLLFDFDGTLADTFPFFLSVFNQLAVKHRFRTLTAEDIESLRHLGAREVMRHVGMSPWRMPFVATDFRRLMTQHTAPLSLFPGTLEALSALRAAGCEMAVVSSNSPENVRRVLGPEVCRLITQVNGGSSIFGKRSRITRVMKALGHSQKDTLYIGDQVTDLISARQAGVHFGAVAWGYAPLVAYEGHAPERVFQDLHDMVHQLTA